MRKVKQFWRVTMARLSVPQYKILAQHRNIIGNNFRGLPRYMQSLRSANIAPEYAEEASGSNKNLNNLLRDKAGFSNFAVFAEKKAEKVGFGDFKNVNKRHFMHVLNIPKNDVEYSQFSLSDVETVCTEKLDNSEVLALKLNSKKVRSFEGRPFERAYSRIQNITKNSRVVNIEDVLRSVRRSLLGTSPMLLAQ